MGAKIGDAIGVLVFIMALTVVLNKRNNTEKVVDSFSKGVEGIFTVVQGNVPTGFQQAT